MTASAWRVRGDGGVEWFELDLPAGPRVSFFTRLGGASSVPYDSLNLSPDVGDYPAQVGANRSRVVATLGIEGLFTMHQVHGERIIETDSENLEKPDPDADACLTTDRDIGLGVRVADCLPVFLWTRDGSAVAIAHCGWRGTLACLALKTARRLADRVGSPLGDVCFALGPCICPACYKVGADVYAAFLAEFPETSRFFDPMGGRAWQLDIRAANRALLLDAGSEERGSLDLCSYERPDVLYSARRDSPTGRNIAVISIRA